MKNRFVQILSLLFVVPLVLSRHSGKISAIHEERMENVPQWGLADPDEVELGSVIVTRISTSAKGLQANGFSGDAVISADGHFLAFQSSANNLVAGDSNNAADIFVKNWQTGEISRVSVRSGGSQGNGESINPSMSADGRFVAFESNASNLVSGDTNETWDVFIHDRQESHTARISIDSNGSQGNNYSHIFNSSISADGRFVTFHSQASNLVQGDTNQAEDVFIHDRQTGKTMRLSVASDGSQADDASFMSAISADGHVVIFTSAAKNLFGGDINNSWDSFAHDLITGETERVSVSSEGSEGNNMSVTLSASTDGRLVVFDSFSSNLIAGDTNNAWDVFVHDRQTGETHRISVSTDGEQANASSHAQSISQDGRFVAFASAASNLTTGDANGASDVFIHDRQSGETRRISTAIDGIEGDADSLSPSISADGQFVAYESSASNLVVGDTNNTRDVFVYDSQGTLLTFSITGRVLDQRLHPLPGVIIEIGTGRTTTTDENGYYSLDHLVRGSYSISPEKPGWFFIPASSLVEVDGISQATQDFVAKPLADHYLFFPYISQQKPPSIVR